MVDAVGTTYYGYDAAGQLLSEAGPWPSDTVTYTYNNRQRASLSLQAPNSDPWTQSYAYDGARRLTNTTSPAGSFSYQYTAPRSLLTSKLLLPNSAYITNTYDSVARLLSTELENSGNTILNAHLYGYNAGNQRTNQTFLNANYENYTYDNIGQLTSALGKESGGVTNRLQEQLKYAYDAAHNLNIRTNNALVQNFNVNDLNELSNVTRTGTLTVAGTSTSPASSVTVNSIGAVLYADATFAKDGFGVTNGNNTFTAIANDSLGRWSTNSITVYLPTNNVFTYDLNGNLLSDGYRTFTYDDENELTSVVVSNGVTTATLTSNIYDGRMRIRIRREYTWSSGWLQTAEVHYIYDGNLVIQERDANNLPTVSYTRGNDLSGSLQGAGGIGGLLARTDMHLIINSTPAIGSATAGQLSTAFYHCDGNGNITALINSLQLIVAKYEYDPFGNITSLSGALAAANVYRFSSKEYLQNSGLYSFGRRFYEPNFQRWLSRDPIGEAGGINLYGFVGNSPLNAIDPFGLDLQTFAPGQFYSIPGPYSYWGSTTTFDSAITAPLLNIMSTVENGAYQVGSGALTLLDMAGEAANWAIDKTVSSLGGNEMDAEGLKLYFAMNPAEMDLAFSGVFGSLSRKCPMEQVRQAGIEGEQAAGIVKNTKRIDSMTGTANYRVPDVLNGRLKIIGDVKNVQYLSMTPQLQDYLLFAQANGYQFQLIIRSDTILSSSVVNSVASGAITVIRMK
jgi:RHS repeat-associated protein